MLWLSHVLNIWRLLFLVAKNVAEQKNFMYFVYACTLPTSSRVLCCGLVFDHSWWQQLLSSCCFNFGSIIDFIALCSVALTWVICHQYFLLYSQRYLHVRTSILWENRIQLDWTWQKINLPTNQRGYDKSETTDEKLSARRIQIFWIYFSVIIFWPPIFKTSQYMVSTKIYP